MKIYLGNFTLQMTRGFRVETTNSSLQYFYNNSWIDIAGGSSSIPVATESSLGGVIIGDGISVEEDGTISVPGLVDLDNRVSALEEANDILESV